ncbi:hypothetical protein FHX34_103533 [Actinoplanes teichomyceticus]|uniref:Uncharacterized protein n=1 Tax=Actinoplanes teichomyceticus TaxID=1867 RepID=A0A561WAW2_ACTTI|nr:hypothetical protein FHX34_103533 [Actinoplanes teichomyceticus]GIF14825.1 hypothetical protein Ate01nite_48570 [Actinoplanes teichomyceticus]
MKPFSGWRAVGRAMRWARQQEGVTVAVGPATETALAGVTESRWHRADAASITTRIRQGSVRCFAPAGSFEACTRSFEGVYTIYARYVGDERTA